MKLCNRLISLLLAVVIVCSMIPLPAHAATGTAISTKEQLNDVRNDLAGSYYLANDIVFTAEDFAEGGAFYNDGAGWTPIGTVDTPFTGTFDGNGFAIKGLQCVAPVDIKMYAGLFGALSGTVKNLGMEGGTITAAITTGSWTIYAGSIAAVVAGGAIENCYNKNAVNATFCNGSGYAGGIAGYSYGTGKVTGTYNAGAITAKDTGTSTYGTCYVGGITGYMASEDGNDTTFETQNCYNSGTVSCTGNVYSSYYVGGVNGAMYGDASGCYNVGNVNVGPVDYICLGGIAGSTWGKISGGYNTGTVSTQAEEYVAIGGIAGTVSYSSSSGRGAIVNCNNSGTVKINPTSTNESDGTFKLGGLAGVASGNVNDSYNVGTVLLQPDLSGCMDAYIYMGGIAGHCNYEGLNGGVLRCYNAGAVTVDGTLKNAIISNIGGVAGFSVGTVVANCFNAADVTMNMTTTYVPSVYVGGVVGNNEIYTVGSTNLGELTNSYNAGGLNITVSNNKNTCIGGVAGDNNTTVRNCYHLDAVSTGIASGTTGGTTACTESQMAQQATFSGFDFTNVWTMAGNSSYLYPELKSVTMYPPKTVTGIQVSTSPKTTYYVGDTLNVSGGKVTVSYSDGSSQSVDMTADMITGFNGNSSGTQTLTVSYAGKTTTFTVTVNGVTLTSIAIYKNPTKTTYVLGETVYADGGEIIAYYNNGTSKVISMTGGEVSVYGVTATQPGSYRMDVYYQGKLAYYYVTFVAPSVTGIKVTTLPKTEYFAGDTMDVSGGKITVYYNNSTTKVVDMTEAMVSGFSTSSTGSKTLTVTYEGKTATYNIQVNAVVITSIAVATMPAKTTYAVGETLDLTGGLLELTYNNGKTETIDLSLATATGFDSATTGEKTVTLTYEGKQTELKVTVICTHNWADAYCAAPETCTKCGATEGAADPDTHRFENGSCIGCGLLGGQCGENVFWTLIDGVLTISGSGAMEDYAEGKQPWNGHVADIKKVVVESGVTAVGDNAFSGCENMEAASIAPSVTAIGKDAFGACNNLTDVYITDSNAWCKTSFENDTANPMYTALQLHILDANGEEVTEIALDDSVVTIPDYAFKGSSLTAVTVGKNVASIGHFAFWDSGSLTSVTIPESVTSIGESAFARTGLHHVLYTGTDAQWANITIAGGNTKLTAAIRHNSATGAELQKASYCTQTGIYCTVCDQYFNQQGEVISHTWVDADCDTPKTCSACSATEGEVLGHDWIAADCDEPKHCSRCTATEGEMLGHDWITADCDEPKHCSRCTATEGEMLGHSWVDADCDTPKTCSACGATEGEAKGHSWVDADCDTPKTCSACGATEGEKLGHNWVAADCDTPKTCSACGETEGEKLGHDWVEADCDTPKTCSVCGETEGEAKGHSWVDADCDTPKTCSVCFATEGAANGHSFGDWFTDTATGEERRDCGNCDHFETRQQPGAGNILPLTGDLAEETVVYIDGQPHLVKKENGSSYVELPSDQETLLVTYTYHVGDANDVHTQYPTGMKVYRVAKTDDAFTATHIPQLDNLLQYSGSSIRITGKKGIRMITSLTKANKSALTGSGLAGFKLLEYGTALCWATDLTDGKDLTLGQSYTRSNYAYKKGVADPVFANTGNLTQYTNVLVGFTDEQCKPDIVMRPYIILQDAAGKQVTLYGGSVHRSVGYIAYQNRNVFKSGSASYKYVWNIIHAVYGNTYDAEFKG